jgi:hypothetical protein
MDECTYSTFAKANLTKLETNTGIKTICGYGNSVILNTTLTANPAGASTTGIIYQWRYASTIAQNGTVFTGANTPSLSIKYIAPPYTATNPNANQTTYKCTATLNGCSVSSNFDTIKAALSVVLTPTPSRCQNDPAAWAIPAPTPAGGTFTAYNITAPNTAITGITTSITATTATLNKTKFAAASTYKLVYSSTAAAVCNDETYMSTYTNCSTLGTSHKVYINEVYKSGTAFRNDGTNDPCNLMKVHFTAFGSFAIGDTLKIKISDKNGKVNKLDANIRQRLLAQYIVKTITSSITDSINIQGMPVFVDTASTNYRVQIFLKKKGLNTIAEWGDKNIEDLNFILKKACTNGGGVICCQSGNRLAPTHFTPEEIQLYPNPTADHFTLNIPDCEAATEVTIVNTQGQIIDKRNIFGTTNEIETHKLPIGMYFVRIAQGKRSTVLKLVIVR